jgi:hypothetical protein
VMSVSSKSILFFCWFFSSFLVPSKLSLPLHKSKSELIKFNQKTTSSNRKSYLGKEASKQAAQSTKFTIYLQNHRASSEIRKRNG